LFEIYFFGKVVVIMRQKAANIIPVKNRSAISYLKKNYEYYLFLVPGLIFIILFDLMPMYNISIAFKNFKIGLGLNNSPWVGLQNFRKMFSDPNFFIVARNTLEINLMKVIIETPIPMLLAIFINEIANTRIKKVVQTVIYLPHFFTWVVVYSVFYIVFGSTGVINEIIKLLGGNQVLFFMNGGWMRFLLVISDIWRDAGWGTIVYLGALTTIDPNIFEAAIVDGANKLRVIWNITLPSLLPTFVLMLSVRLGNIMTAGFGQVLVFYNPTVYKSVDMISTYTYRTGLGQANYSYGTAIGLFNSVIGFILVVLSNWISRATTNRTIW